MKVEFWLQDEYPRAAAMMRVVPAVGDSIDFSTGLEDGAQASWLKAVVTGRTYQVARKTWLLSLAIGENVPEVEDVPELWRGAGFDVPEA